MNAVVETTHGTVRGSVQGPVRVFKGIPYAASAAGHRRFRAPADPAPWPGVRSATEHGPTAPQLTPEQNARSNPWQLRAMERAMAAVVAQPRTEHRQGEDCLVLNVFTPGTDQAKRAVMVWFHGGAWVVGSAAEPWFDGANLAHRGDVVVVTVNHRLGLFGYLNLTEHGGPEYAESGYAGVLDLVAALRWVHDNIASFGGDPGNVTIFGQSGGGEKVAALLGTPAAAGLFHKAIMQSGLGGRSFSSRAYSLRLADTMMRRLDLTHADALREVPSRWVLEVQLALMQQAFTRAFHTRAAGVRPQFHEAMIFSPVWPGLATADTAPLPAIAAASPDVPLLIGSLADETALTRPALSVPILEESGLSDVDAVGPALTPVLGPHSAGIVTAYHDAHPHLEPADLLTAITTDQGFRIPAIRYAQHRVAARAAPVYMYLATWGVPVTDGRRQAPHGIDIPLVFHNLDRSPFWPADGPHPRGLSRMAAIVGDAWVAFARTGKPSRPELPDWPPYAPDCRSTMVLDDTCHVVNDPGGTARRAWEGFVDHQFGLAGELETVLETR